MHPGKRELDRKLPEACRRMDEEMVERWNAVVGPKDHVIHLGDFAHWRAPFYAVDRIFRSLNGAKSLIIGNHDKEVVIRDLPWGPFSSQANRVRSPADNHTLSACDETLFLSHYAHRSWLGMNRGVLHAYGHSHQNIPTYGGSMDVGVDNPFMQLAPQPLEVIIPTLARLREAEKDLQAQLVEKATRFGLTVNFPDNIPSLYRKEAAGGIGLISRFADCHGALAFMEGLMAAQTLGLRQK